MIALLVLVADQVSKQWVLATLPPSTAVASYSIAIIPDILYFTHVLNSGSLWGLFPNQSLLLAGLALVIIAAIVIFRRQLELKKTNLQIIFGLLTGGILGNFIDRIAYRHVIDFIDVHLPFYRWPTFNIADCGISIGAVLYLFYTLYYRPPHIT